MVDITKIQLNPIPLPIIELQSANDKLLSINNTLRNIIIAGGVIAIIYFGNKILKSIKEENERKNKKEIP